MVNVEKLLTMKADAIIDDLCKLHKATMVKPVSALQADIVDIPGKIVKLISINARLAIRDDIIQKGWFERRFINTPPMLLPRNQVTNMLHILATNFEGILIDHMLQQHNTTMFMHHKRMIIRHRTSTNSR